MKKTNLVDELYALLEKEGKELKDNIYLEQEGLRIQIYDDEGYDTDDAFLYETYGVYDALEFLENNDLLN